MFDEPFNTEKVFGEIPQQQTDDGTMITIVLSDGSKYTVDKDIGEKLKQAFIAGNIPEYVLIKDDIVRTSWIGKIVGGN